MEVVQNRVAARKSKLTMQQAMYIILRGFGHLVTMAGFVYLLGSAMYFAFQSATVADLIAGVLLIIGGAQIQQLSEKLEERHVMHDEHLDLHINQLVTRTLSIAVVVSMFLLA